MIDSDLTEKRYSVEDIVNRLFDGMTDGEMGYTLEGACSQIEKLLRDGFNIDPKKIDFSVNKSITLEVRK